MQRALLFVFGTTLVIATAIVFALSGPSGVRAAAADDGATMEPVDESMHHFMEYLYEPRYKSLKAQLADPPADKAAWSVVKADSLTLAEGANLLLTRLPDEKVKNWKAHAVAVRASGGELYQAARKSDYATARKHYEHMLTRCNACHKEFADGKHQLKP